MTSRIPRNRFEMVLLPQAGSKTIILGNGLEISVLVDKGLVN